MVVVARFICSDPHYHPCTKLRAPNHTGHQQPENFVFCPIRGGAVDPVHHSLGSFPFRFSHLFLRLGSLCIPDRPRTAEPFPCQESVSLESRFV
jgi:hypothetical protein